MLKGNTGAKGEDGKDGKDGEITTEQLEAALRDGKYLATAATNGLMSIEQVKLLKDLEDMFKSDEDKFDFVVTAFTTSEATPKSVGSHTVHYNSVGSAKYKLITKETSYESVAKNANQYVTMLTSCENDITKLHVSDVYKITASTSDGISMLRLSSKNQKQLDNFDISGTKFTYLDLSGMYNLKILTAVNCNLASLNTLAVMMLTILKISNSKQLKSMNVWGQNITSVNASNATLLSSFYFDSSLGNLRSIDISGTALSLVFVTHLESKWASRSGMDTGVFRLNKALYEQMSSELRAKYTNKNITFDIVE